VDVGNNARQYAAIETDYGLRARVYTCFMAELRLQLRHREELRGRGIDGVAMVRDGYRTLDQETGFLACRKLIEYFGRDKVLETPGFQEIDGEIYPTVKEGLAVPVLNLRGWMEAIQVRVGGRNVKYATLSGGPGGSVGTPVHVPVTSVPAILAGRPWAVTEGPIKANIATERWLPTVGLLGATATNPVLRMVDNQKPETVVLAFDMDRYQKPNVLQAQDKLADRLDKYGVKVSIAHWDEKFKGLDDALVGGATVVYDGAEPRLRGGTN
jgi:hypothetical protein